MMNNNQLISDFREFTRFYTNIIGLLNNHLLNSPYTLPEARVLFEIAQQPRANAKVLIQTLTIDKGYLSRILKSFEKKKIIRKTIDRRDGRAIILLLTKKGKQDFKALNIASEKQVTTLLTGLPPASRKNLVTHMNSIRTMLSSYSSL
jgi:DNA-binding MarR family transcriptional regulator